MRTHNPCVNRKWTMLNNSNNELQANNSQFHEDEEEEEEEEEPCILSTIRTVYFLPDLPLFIVEDRSIVLCVGDSGQHPLARSPRRRRLEIRIGAPARWCGGRARNHEGRRSFRPDFGCLMLPV